MEQATVCGVYRVVNVSNRKCYVGSSVNVNKRWRSHIGYLNRGNHQSIKFQRAWDKYGKDAFLWEMLEEVEDVETLLAREQHWIDTFKPEYNTTLTVGTTMLGHKHSAETVARMSVAAIRRSQDPAYIEKLRVKNAGWANIKGGDWLSKLSPEDREKHLESIRGRPSPLRGQQRSEEMKEKCRLAAIIRYNGSLEAYEEKRRQQAVPKPVRPMSEEHKTMLAQARRDAYVQRGRKSKDPSQDKPRPPLSEAHKEVLRQAAIKARRESPMTDEHKAKLAQARKESFARRGVWRMTQTAK